MHVIGNDCPRATRVYDTRVTTRMYVLPREMTHPLRYIRMQFGHVERRRRRPGEVLFGRDMNKRSSAAHLLLELHPQCGDIDRRLDACFSISPCRNYFFERSIPIVFESLSNIFEKLRRNRNETFAASFVRDDFKILIKKKIGFVVLFHICRLILLRI